MYLHVLKLEQMSQSYPAASMGGSRHIAVRVQAVLVPMACLPFSFPDSGMGIAHVTSLLVNLLSPMRLFGGDQQLSTEAGVPGDVRVAVFVGGQAQLSP